MNYRVNENSGPPKNCTFDIWPVTRKRLPTPVLNHRSYVFSQTCEAVQIRAPLAKLANSSQMENAD